MALQLSTRVQTVRGTHQPRALAPMRPSLARQSRNTKTCVLANDLSSTQQQPKSFLDMALDTVLRLFGDEHPKQPASDELQLPPELLAYLEEMEKHSGSHGGGWGHSHIADRLASLSHDSPTEH